MNRLYCIECERELGLVEESGKRKFSKIRMIKIFMIVLVIGLGIGITYSKFSVKFGWDNIVSENGEDDSASIPNINNISSKQKMIVGTVYDAYLSSMKNENIYSSVQYAILDINKGW